MPVTFAQLGIVLLLIGLAPATVSGQKERWLMTGDGGVAWRIYPTEKHKDHIEMSGRQISVITTYAVDRQKLSVSKKLIYPMLRTLPNNTHASFSYTDSFDVLKETMVNGAPLNWKVNEVYHKGYMKIEGLAPDIEIERYYFPSTTKAAFIELNYLKNTGTRKVQISVPASPRDYITPANKGVYGSYIVHAEVQEVKNNILEPGTTLEVPVIYSARKQAEPFAYISGNYEFIKRKALLQELYMQPGLETPDPVLDRMFEFAKIRLCESIFDTHGGLMHSPGGGPFYAAIWANDQAEYVSPLFPFMGYAEGNESALNCYRLFATFMNDEFRPIPSSIIAEGIDTWHGAGDRGDQAMIAYGASRFALAYGNEAAARELWTLIEWCLTYLQKKKNQEGVIPSDSDELEGRFSSGKINLATNSLAYGAMVSASRLASALGYTSRQKIWEQEALKLKKAIESFFGAKIEGFNTYRYHDGNNKLRSWICLPLAMGIMDRKDETVRALLSKQLWTENGILTESGDKTFWDRSTLYAFRGLFNAGETDSAVKYLGIYARKRLLGDHVPYAVEAWPEGNQRQLSGESGLYCRVITEGLFGIDPLSFKRFYINPVLPDGWDQMQLKHIRAFNADLTIKVQRSGKNHLKLTVSDANKIVLQQLYTPGIPVLVSLKK